MRDIKVLLPFLLAIFFHRNAAGQSLTRAEGFSGTVTAAMYQDDKASMQQKSIIHAGFILEPRIRVDIKSRQDFASGTNSSTMKENVTGYILDNLKDSVSIFFDLKQQVESRMPFSRKTLGLQLGGDIREVKSFINEFFHSGDTIIRGKRYKVLTCDLKASKTKPPGFSKIVLFSNQTQKDIPFHPVSSTLDRKFGGFIDQVKYFQDGDMHSLSFDFKFEKGLEQPERDKIKSFIKSYK